MQRADRALRAGVRRLGRFALDGTLFQQRQSVSEGKSDRSTRKDRKAGLQVIQNLVMLHAPSGI
jgi:hypothetical protein